MITFNVNGKELDFEHSLVSLSVWESEFEKPFYSHKKDEQRDLKEMKRYFECMYIGPRKYNHLIQLLSDDQQIVLADYITKAQSATTIREIQQNRGSRENITSELIYYWLVTFRIPFKPTDEWHLNRLLMLVKVCSVKNAPAPKTRQSKASLAQSMRDLNEQRRRELGTKG